MARIGQKDTAPEMVVRRMLHSKGFRYRLHDRKLPGTPDIVFRARKKLIFVNGCFWHMHGCHASHVPKTNIAFWKTKLLRNKRRDADRLKKLKALGWSTFTVWECDVHSASLAMRLTKFLLKKK